MVRVIDRVIDSYISPEDTSESESELPGCGGRVMVRVIDRVIDSYISPEDTSESESELPGCGGESHG